MNIFKSTTFTYWQLGLFKLCVLATGVVIGAYWYQFFGAFLLPLLVIAIVLGVYIFIVWFKQR